MMVTIHEPLSAEEKSIVYVLLSSHRSLSVILACRYNRIVDCH